MASTRSGLKVLIALSLFMLAGCSNNDTTNPTDGNATIPQILSVQPPNGAAGVPQGANVRVVFNMPMDTASVDHAFHMAGGPGMTLWMDSLAARYGMGGHRMGMDSMMRWMDTLQYHGSFQWNHRMDSMVFVPDTLLMGNQPHVVFLYGTVKGQNGRAMVMDTFTYGGYMTQFTTGAQASP